LNDFAQSVPSQIAAPGRIVRFCPVLKLLRWEFGAARRQQYGRKKVTLGKKA
jgi:hypothetical protein